MAGAPGGLMLEPNERVLLATRPLFLWEPLMLLDIRAHRPPRHRALGRAGPRPEAALLLDRIQDASLSRPFPLWPLRDYGVLHLEFAGEHAEGRIGGGLRELGMTGATAFYRTLTNAQTKG